MDQTYVLITILGMAAVTYLPRVLPLWLLAGRNLSPVIIKWLSYIPVAVLSALTLPSLLIREEYVDVGFDNFFLWAAIPTLLFALKTKSLFGSVIVGMGLVAGLRFFIG